ncbi:N-acetyltransferase [Paenibacillus albiflavus]|uniref:N-acetyltransferase n=1 Tax=Paenibacillus albiflavus TaxID=2545760 RepID=A0A4R4EJ67_9BACL|nr:GNAT family N-acetyltransferase [Paenibacillus albiflavus]TCZ79290.1 N-acetyltransferase [Paenibacillus albiflavus]
MNPILLDFPTQFFTDRLLIRMPEEGDGKAAYEAIQASIDDLKPWMPFANKEQTEETIESNARTAKANFIKREDLRFHIFLKDTLQFIGISGFHHINWNVPKFEIGYWIDSRYSGKGYIGEAVQGITQFAFTELKARRVEIRCDALNHKSRAIPEKMGYTLEGILKNDDLSADGQEIRDTCIYAKI